MKRLICLLFVMMMLTPNIVALGNADDHHNAYRCIETSTYR